MPSLPYSYNALEPEYNEESLSLHYDVLLRKYTDKLNSTLEKLDNARNTNNYEHIKALKNELSFNGSGYLLHSLFFYNLTPKEETEISPNLFEQIINDFGSFRNFEEEFKATAINVEASGWCILGFSRELNKLFILQCEKHQDLVLWGIVPLLVIDVWEHSYYLQYKTDRTLYIQNIWRRINWEIVSSRFTKNEKRM